MTERRPTRRSDVVNACGRQAVNGIYWSVFGARVHDVGSSWQIE